MNVSAIGIQNNIQSEKNPNFKKFGGIDSEFRTQFNSAELTALLKEAENFVESHFCDIKYAKGPHSTTYCVAVNLKNSPVLKNEPMITKYGVCGTKRPININSIGWKIINCVSCPSYMPYYLDFADYDYPECNHYILPDIDDETRQVFENHKSRLERKFRQYPNLQYEYNLREGLAFAYAYEAYWTRQESENTNKNKLDTAFNALTNS